jgi:hypothetical protein
MSYLMQHQAAACWDRTWWYSSCAQQYTTSSRVARSSDLPLGWSIYCYCYMQVPSDTAVCFTKGVCCAKSGNGAVLFFTHRG